MNIQRDASLLSALDADPLALTSSKEPASTC